MDTNILRMHQKQSNQTKILQSLKKHYPLPVRAPVVQIESGLRYKLVLQYLGQLVKAGRAHKERNGHRDVKYVYVPAKTELGG